MNVVVACDKTFKKSIKPLIENKEKDIKVLHIENLVKKDFVDNIISINPHILIILRGVKYKDTTEEEFLNHLIALNSHIRVIYMYGTVIDEKEFADTVNVLCNMGIYSIIRGRILPDDIQELIKSPMTYNEAQDLIDENYREKADNAFESEDIEVDEDEGIEELFEKALEEDNAEVLSVPDTEEVKEEKPITPLPIELKADTDNINQEEKINKGVRADTERTNVRHSPTPAPMTEKPSFLKNDSFDFFVIERETEQEKKVTEVVGNIVVGVAELINRCGCTFASIELAKVIKDNGFDVGVVLSDENTYNNLSKYYLQDKEIFFMFENIKIYSPNGLSIAKGEHSIVIYDIGKLDDNNISLYEETQIKLMMSDGSEWNLPILERYIEESISLPYIKQVHFCFQNIGKERFTEIYRALNRKGISQIHRLITSETVYKPSNDNIKAYKTVMKSVFASKNSEKDGKKKFLGVF